MPPSEPTVPADTHLRVRGAARGDDDAGEVAAANEHYLVLYSSAEQMSGQTVIEHPAKAYARAKRGLLDMTRWWAQQSDNHSVIFHAMHPGWADTQAVLDSLPEFYRITKPFLRDAAQGADTIVWLAAAPEPLTCNGEPARLPTTMPPTMPVTRPMRSAKRCGTDSSKISNRNTSPRHCRSTSDDDSVCSARTHSPGSNRLGVASTAAGERTDRKERDEPTGERATRGRSARRKPNPLFPDFPAGNRAFG